MDEDHKPARWEEWRAPLLLGGGGLALLLVGYFLLDASVPRPPQVQQQYEQWKQLRDMAARDPHQQPLARELDRMQPSPPSLPLRTVGVVAFWAGLLLFVAAGIRMYQYRPSSAAEEEEESEEISEKK